jgi:hypothetical protein
VRRAPLLVLALLVAGCGAPPADLFVVTRTGSGTNADVTLLVQDDGSVICNHGKTHPISNAQLLQARRIVHETADQAKLNLQLPKRPGSVLSYHARMEAGTIAFSDTSRPLPSSFARLEAFTSDIVTNVCGLSHG